MKRTYRASHIGIDWLTTQMQFRLGLLDPFGVPTIPIEQLPEELARRLEVSVMVSRDVLNAPDGEQLRGYVLPAKRLIILGPQVIGDQVAYNRVLAHELAHLILHSPLFGIPPLPFDDVVRSIHVKVALSGEDESRALWSAPGK
jgi:hypothetical protein